MKPFILVTPSFNENGNNSKYMLNNYYTKAVLDSGGIPLLTPYENIEFVDEILDKVSGLILSGGGDIHSSFFNEELDERACYINEIRDEFEINLCLKAIERNMPILAICRGCQLLNVALGGNIHQHIDGHVDPQDDDLTHKISVVENSLFDRLYDNKTFNVNSIHHQCIDKYSDDIEILAYCDDIIEGIRLKNKKFIVGVQYHPERIYNKTKESKILFDEFIKSCK